MRNILDSWIRFGFSLGSTRLSAISCVMYHSVSDIQDPLCVAPQEFEAQMRYIHERKMRTVFASEVPALMHVNRGGAVCVTLDDGYADNYTHVLPILKRYNIKATIFLITGSTGSTFTTSRGDTFALLSETQIREMRESGLVEFAPHSHTHRVFTQLREDEIQSEIARSQDVLRALGGATNVFAYPRSKVPAGVGSVLRAQGVEAAFGGRPGLITHDSDPYNIPRTLVPRGERMATFRLKLSDAWESYNRSKAWIRGR